MKLKKVDIFLVLCSALCFWFVYFSIDRQFINLRGSIVEMESSPILFWSFLMFVACFGLYALGSVFFEKE